MSQISPSCFGVLTSQGLNLSLSQVCQPRKLLQDVESLAIEFSRSVSVVAGSKGGQSGQQLLGRISKLNLAQPPNPFTMPAPIAYSSLSCLLIIPLPPPAATKTTFSHKGLRLVCQKFCQFKLSVLCLLTCMRMYRVFQPYWLFGIALFTRPILPIP